MDGLRGWGAALPASGAQDLMPHQGRAELCREQEETLDRSYSPTDSRCVVCWCVNNREGPCVFRVELVMGAEVGARQREGREGRLTQGPRC